MAIIPIQNEQFLVKKVAQGDEVSFRQLFEHYSDSVFSVAFSYCKSLELSEEIVQDVFLKIWLKKEQLENLEKFSNYLFIVARNHILNVLRTKAKEPIFVAMLENYFMTSTAAADDILNYKESGQMINEAIKELSPKQQTAFLLCRVEGLSHQEAADKMNLSRLTVKYHIQQALRTMREYLKKNNTELMVITAILIFYR